MTKNNPFNNRYFKIGFLAGIILLCVMNLVSDYFVYLKSCKGEFRFSVCGGTSGFPFEMHQFVLGYPNRSSFILSGVLGNSIVAILLGFALGMFFLFLSLKISKYMAAKR